LHAGCMLIWRTRRARCFAALAAGRTPGGHPKHEPDRGNGRNARAVACRVPMRVAVPEGSPTPPDHPYAPFLAQMQKPGRYLGGEEQQVVKDPRGLVCRFVLAFPDLYEVGMSHLGTRILYDLVNRQPDLVCERAFSPWRDLEEELRTRKVPLVSLETYQPLASFDVVGFSLQYE